MVLEAVEREENMNRGSYRGILIMILLILIFMGLSWVSTYFFIKPDEPTEHYFLYALISPIVFAIIAGLIAVRIIKK